MKFSITPSCHPSDSRVSSTDAVDPVGAVAETRPQSPEQQALLHGRGDRGAGGAPDRKQYVVLAITAYYD